MTRIVRLSFYSLQTGKDIARGRGVWQTPKRALVSIPFKRERTLQGMVTWMTSMKTL